MSASQQQQQAKRKKNTIFTRRIVYGNMAQWLGEDVAVEGVKTHKWTCFLRPYDPAQDDFSYIKKTQIILHPTFSNHTRNFTKLPMEVSESGWGEFEITIRMLFVDDSTHDISFLLKLYPADGTRPRELCMFEYVDELVFLEPTEHLHQVLQQQQQQQPNTITTNTTSNKKKVDHFTQALLEKGISLDSKANEQLLMLQNALATVQSEVGKIEERLKRIEKDTEDTKKETEQLTKSKQPTMT